jgi:hypothetical protein
MPPAPSNGGGFLSCLQTEACSGGGIFLVRSDRSDKVQQRDFSGLSIIVARQPSNPANSRAIWTAFGLELEYKEFTRHNVVTTELGFLAHRSRTSRPWEWTDFVTCSTRFRVART